jgi:hypothetical protein
VSDANNGTKNRVRGEGDTVLATGERTDTELQVPMQLKGSGTVRELLVLYRERDHQQ